MALKVGDRVRLPACPEDNLPSQKATILQIAPLDQKVLLVIDQEDRTDEEGGLVIIEVTHGELEDILEELKETIN